MRRCLVRAMYLNAPEVSTWGAVTSVQRYLLAYYFGPPCIITQTSRLFNLQAMSCCEDPSVTNNAASACIVYVAFGSRMYNTLPRPGVLSRLDSADDARHDRWNSRLAAGQVRWWNGRTTYRSIDRKQYRCRSIHT